jgi:hypothetical protein
MFLNERIVLNGIAFYNTTSENKKAMKNIFYLTIFTRNIKCWLEGNFHKNMDPPLICSFFVGWGNFINFAAGCTPF